VLKVQVEIEIAVEKKKEGRGVAREGADRRSSDGGRRGGGNYFCWESRRLWRGRDLITLLL